MTNLQTQNETKKPMEGRPMTKLFGLLACSTLAVVSVLLYSYGDAEETLSPFDAMKKGGTSNATPNPFERQIDPFKTPVVDKSSSTPSSAIRQRIADLLIRSRESLKKGNRPEALRLALSAQSLSKRFHVSFDNPVDNPSTLVAQLHPEAASPLVNKEAPAWKSNSIVKQGLNELNPNRSLTNDEMAQTLIEQARIALKNQQFDDARELAMEAGKIKKTWDLFEDRPENVLAEIEANSGQKLFSKNQSNVAQLTPNPFPPTPVVTSAGGDADKAKALELLKLAEESLNDGNLVQARQYAQDASKINASYGLLELNPQVVMSKIQTAEKELMFAATKTSSPRPFPSKFDAAALPGAMKNDSMVKQTAANLSGTEYYNQGLGLLQKGNHDQAYGLFVQAYQNRADLNSYQQQQLQDFLRELAPRNRNAIRMVKSETVDGKPAMKTPGVLDIAAEKESIQIDRLQSAVMNAIFKAERLREKNSDKALSVLDEAKKQVDESNLTKKTADVLLASLARSRRSIESYMTQKAPLIELQRRNNEVKDRLKQEQEYQYRLEQDLANLNEEFNRLMKERRYKEAAVIGRKAKELAPNNPVAVIMSTKAKLAKQIAFNEDLKEQKEDSFLQQLNDVELSAVNPVARDSIAFPKNWEDYNDRKNKYGAGNGNKQDSPEEKRIKQSLNQTVSLDFENRPIREILQHIQQSTGINIVVDYAGMEDDTGVTSDTPVTVKLTAIPLKSVLNNMLENLNLGYTIKNDVLKITSSQRLQGEMEAIVYQVADLVVPLTRGLSGPNGSPMNQIQTGYGMSVPVAGANSPFGGSYPQVGGNPLASNGPIPAGGFQSGARPEGQVEEYEFDALKQLLLSTIDPLGWTEVGGRGSIEVFESTLSLVIRTTQPVHNQIKQLLEQLRRLQDLQVTIEVRFISVSDRFFERIGVDFDFNLQDTIGGPDRDIDGVQLPPFGAVVDPANINSGTTVVGGGGAAGAAGGAGAAGAGGAAGAAQAIDSAFDLPPNRNLISQDRYGSNGQVVGLLDSTTFNPDLDIPFRQGSFQVGVPDFGNFNPEVGLQVGFAILSDIEAFFFIQAAQSDERSNIMFAPKITLFNGQPGFVTDSVARPFVTSLVPAVGAFSVGFQPIISTINEGVSLNVQAIVSADRRYVRLSVTPNFSNITDVFTFTFAGGAGGGGAAGAAGGAAGAAGGGFGGVGGGAAGGGFGGGGVGGGFGGIGGVGGGAAGAAGGAGGFGGGAAGGQAGAAGGQQGAAVGNLTVQQPVIEVVTVITTVSVPDGGTVLLGGVKRLREGRNMAGVPILNKIPYVSRLFKNTGVGRETESLMLMVTPRIIIQEEEEALLNNTN